MSTRLAPDSPALPFLLLMLAAACQAETVGPSPRDPASRLEHAPAATQGSEVPSEPWPLFGVELGPEEPVEVEELIEDAQANAKKTFVVEGTVSEVCLMKGCWMVVGEGEQSVRVTFKDYAFFVPMDIAGRKVRCEGVFDFVELPVDLARHYLEDAGRHEEARAITEPVPSYVMVATGVRVEPAQ